MKLPLTKLSNADFEEARAGFPNFTGFPMIYTEFLDGTTEVWPKPITGFKIVFGDSPYAEWVKRPIDQ